jgi:hypothetical protein
MSRRIAQEPPAPIYADVTLARAEEVQWFFIGSNALAGITRDRILNDRSIDFVRSWAGQLGSG